jgi:hypothetical protein
VLSAPPRMSSRGLRSPAWLLAVASKLMPYISFDSFASYSLWPMIPVTEPIPSAPATAAWTIPQVIVTSPTEASFEPIEYSEEVKMPLPGDEGEESSAFCTTASLDLSTLGSVAKEDANQVSLAHLYVHGGDLFTILEADEPIECSTSEAEMSRFVLSLATFSPSSQCSFQHSALASIAVLPQQPLHQRHRCSHELGARD